MDNILVPIDFSETSSYALEVAAKIAKEQNAHITVLHMLGLSEAIFTKDETQEYHEAKYYMELAKKRFTSFLDQPYLKGLAIKQIVQNYKIFSELNNVCHEHNIDLIVMGSHGTKGVSELFVGSNTEKVVRTSDVPVLVIKEQNPTFKIKKIVFACSFKDDSILAFKKALDFAHKFSAKLLPIYINTPYNDFMSTKEIDERISKFMFKAGEPNKDVYIYNDYSVELGLFNYSKKEEIDVLAIPTHGRKGLSHFFLGSIGEDVANHANLPVITFKL
ncbi:universal stress protein [Maribacter sp. CXY002]|uniref:universal stress protein n=1 Tax=Maribacter luteocoastalis TaxID=3407671 RepID=UPI003B6816C4